MTGSCDDSVTRGVVIGNCATGFWYARAVVEPALVVQRDRTVVLKMQRFRPVVRENLESRNAVNIGSF
jgi:hypothetical protein